MTSERVTITIRSNIGDDGPLTVGDAMRQILDFFEVLSSSQNQEAGGDAVSWQLISISKSSPLEATAEPYSDNPNVPVNAIARRAKVRLASTISEITQKGRVPAWVDPATRDRLRKILKRNLNGIGRTDFKVDEQSPLVTIIERTARSGLLTLEQAELAAKTKAEDLSRAEMGSVEGDVTQTTTYHKRPAVVIRDRLTGTDITCVLPDNLAQEIGSKHNWHEVWNRVRVLVSGEIFYKANGEISRVNVTDMTLISPAELSSTDIHDTEFTSGLSPAEYLEKLREGEIG